MGIGKKSYGRAIDIVVACTTIFLFAYSLQLKLRMPAQERNVEDSIRFIAQDANRAKESRSSIGGGAVGDERRLAPAGAEQRLFCARIGKSFETATALLSLNAIKPLSARTATRFAQILDEVNGGLAASDHAFGPATSRAGDALRNLFGEDAADLQKKKNQLLRNELQQTGAALQSYLTRSLSLSAAQSDQLIAAIRRAPEYGMKANFLRVMALATVPRRFLDPDTLSDTAEQLLSSEREGLQESARGMLDEAQYNKFVEMINQNDFIVSLGPSLY